MCLTAAKLANQHIRVDKTTHAAIAKPARIVNVRRNHLIRPYSLDGLVKSLQTTGKHTIIGIDEGDVTPRGSVESYATGTRNPAISHVYHPQTSVLRRKPVANLPRAVRTTVVNGHNLKVVHLLIKNAAQTSLKVIELVVHRYDYRYFHIYSPSR